MASPLRTDLLPFPAVALVARVGRRLVDGLRGSDDRAGTQKARTVAVQVRRELWCARRGATARDAGRAVVVVGRELRLVLRYCWEGAEAAARREGVGDERHVELALEARERRAHQRVALAEQLERATHPRARARDLARRAHQKRREPAEVGGLQECAAGRVGVAWPAVRFERGVEHLRAAAKSRRHEW